MELFEFFAFLCGKQKFPESFPESFEVRFVCTEDLAEPLAVATVYQSDQVGGSQVVCELA